jgi:2-iminobutanoate/2-iminopropanoate deaminase
MSDPIRVHTDDAPAAIGPYSQAMTLGNLVFTAGQIALDPASMEIVDGDVAAQTDRVFQNLAAILERAGSGLSAILKTTVYLDDMDDFAAMNEVYARHMGDHRPARSTVEVSRLPKDVKVEIDAIGYVARST